MYKELDGTVQTCTPTESSDIQDPNRRPNSSVISQLKVLGSSPSTLLVTELLGLCMEYRTDAYAMPVQNILYNL